MLLLFTSLALANPFLFGIFSSNSCRPNHVQVTAKWVPQNEVQRRENEKASLAMRKPLSFDGASLLKVMLYGTTIESVSSIKFDPVDVLILKDGDLVHSDSGPGDIANHTSEYWYNSMSVLIPYDIQPPFEVRFVYLESDACSLYIRENGKVKRKP